MLHSNTRDVPLQTGNSREDKTRIRNRRIRWLEKHPGYFSDASREIADPLLYDRLVRRFMTAEERERQGRQRGFAETLEASLTRSEAKIEALDNPDPDDPLVYVRAKDGAITGIERNEAARPASKQDAWDQWTEIITQKFINGGDRDFDYTSVDQDEHNDDQAEEDRSALEQYLDTEEQFVGNGVPQGETGVQDY